MKHLIDLSLRQARRLVITVLGSTVLLLGLVFIPLPGPGLLGVIAGLAILATEFVWARRLLKRIREKSGQVRDAIMNATRRDDSDPNP